MIALIVTGVWIIVFLLFRNPVGWRIWLHSECQLVLFDLSAMQRIFQKRMVVSRQLG
jgi:hypothetical protein